MLSTLTIFTEIAICAYCTCVMNTWMMYCYTHIHKYSDFLVWVIAVGLASASPNYFIVNTQRTIVTDLWQNWLDLFKLTSFTKFLLPFPVQSTHYITLVFVKRERRGFLKATLPWSCTIAAQQHSSVDYHTFGPCMWLHGLHYLTSIVLGSRSVMGKSLFVDQIAVKNSTN